MTIDWAAVDVNLTLTVKPSSGPGLVGEFAQCLSHHGYTLLANYQPASRFWPFQAIEGG
jgi:hypothetical protein